MGTKNGSLIFVSNVIHTSMTDVALATERSAV
jgi:hypothetical protein